MNLRLTRLFSLPPIIAVVMVLDRVGVTVKFLLPVKPDSLFMALTIASLSESTPMFTVPPSVVVPLIDRVANVPTDVKLDSRTEPGSPVADFATNLESRYFLLTRLFSLLPIWGTVQAGEAL